MWTEEEWGVRKKWGVRKLNNMERKQQQTARGRVNDNSEREQESGCWTERMRDWREIKSLQSTVHMF